MAGLIDVGYVAPAGQDFLPSTGPHLDVRVLKDGKYIDPSTIRSLLTRIKIGKEKTPLWQQTGDHWNPSFPITSGYGAREAPTAGASTFHPAQDYGVAGGTQLAWEGPGTFTPGQGYGTIKTTDPQGNPYEIRLLHTKGGKAAELSGLPTQPTIQQRTGDTYIIIPSSKQKSQDFLAEYAQQLMGGQAGFTPKSIIDPSSMLAAAFQTPDYLS